MPSKLELLSRVPLFAELDIEDLHRVAAKTRTDSFTAGGLVFEIGEPGRSLFIISEGEVQLIHPGRDSTHVLARLGPGDFFGEMALLSDTPRSATARAIERVEALVLDKGDFRQLLMDRPEVSFKLLEAQSSRIRNADAQIGGLTSRAVTDPLTGLPNRRAFQGRLLEETDRVRRYGGSFSVILIDPDEFVAINEDLGHPTGDLVLTWIGRILSEHTRASDLPFRFGRDKFTVLCPLTDSAVVRAVAERLAAIIGEARPPIDDEVRMTVSYSCVTCPDDGEDPDSLYHAARQALDALRKA